MQTDPTARHSPIGSFQRVCYLVHLARDGRMAAAPGTRPPALHPDRRRARWEGQTEVAVDLSGVGRFPKAFGAKLARRATRQRQRRRHPARHNLAVAAQGLHPPRPRHAHPQPRSRPPARHRRRPPAHRPAGHPKLGSGVCGPQPGRPPGPRAVTGRAVSVGPPRGPVRHLGCQRGRRAVQRKPRSPAYLLRLGDHPTRRPQPPDWPANAPAVPSAATPTVPTALAGPSSPRSGRWRPMLANLHLPDRPDSEQRFHPGVVGL
jgi:hypothetical protein